MNNTKGTETKAYDLLYSHLMSNIKKDYQTDKQLYYFRLLLEKYNEERNEHN
jgi:hypothetical protein